MLAYTLLPSSYALTPDPDIDLRQPSPEVDSDHLRWFALLVSMREGPSGPSRAPWSPLLPTGGLRLEVQKQARVEPKMAKVKVQRHIHQQPVTKGHVRTMEAFSTRIAVVSRQFCSLMEKTYRNMAYKIQNNGLRCTLYEGVRLQCTLQWGN